jgi:acyl-CoA thioester hydrolase
MAGRKLVVGDLFEYDIPMRWSDSDALHHMNNAMYFTFMEEGRVKLLMDAGIGLPAEQVPVLAHSTCDFIRSVTYPATVRVHYQIVRIGRSSLECQIKLTVPDQTADEVYASSRIVLVWMDWKSGKSVPWSDEVLMKFGRVCRPGKLENV